MRKSLAINVAKIGQNLDISFGSIENKPSNSIHFNDILSEWTREFLETTSLTTPEEQFTRLKGLLKLTREHNMYRIEGEIEFEPLLECVRSLTPFREKVTAHVSAYFVPETSAAFKNSGISRYMNDSKPEEEIELESSDLETYSYNGNFIELDEFIIDSLYLALPELPLCKEDCKGLCSSCGTELNEVYFEGKKISPIHTKNCSYN
ncbi:YceD family protein [Fluviispira multicolorata]|uniref:DUF177 domain-containing protein n=1 Tax=Fluviispira multicolorata TaxID=2654512 RepID=A0A833N5K4_9BACT|nr:DUF177 domain-containing protein [Fluviispira multicolorata]KAB8033489.1 hypothetical protein GCL57_01945 [Fluviispira multicolorata]